MRFGYWMPIFGGWLRNVPDERMSTAWPYLRDLAADSERQGFELTLIAELTSRATGPPHWIAGPWLRRWPRSPSGLS